jgi:hypothetical protein
VRRIGVWDLSVLWLKKQISTLIGAHLAVHLLGPDQGEKTGLSALSMRIVRTCGWSPSTVATEHNGSHWQT